MEGIEILQPELAVNGICWHPVSKGERKLLKAVARGDLDKDRIVSASSLKCSVNSVNNSGKTVLQIASELIESTVRNDMINLLLHGGADLELALLHAVRESDVRGVEILLQFHNPSSPKRMSPDSMSLKYQRHFTPLILAACLQNFKIVKLLLEHGFSIPNLPIDLKKPVGSEINFDGKLGLTLFRLNRYRALASPVYMAASFLQNPFSDPDPVHRACALSKELSHMAEREHEFRQEYLELSDGCKEFTVDLLNGCRSMKEIRCVMEMENEKSTPLNTDGVVLNILEFAIVTRNEKVCSSFLPIILNVFLLAFLALCLLTLIFLNLVTNPSFIIYSYRR